MSSVRLVFFFVSALAAASAEEIRLRSLRWTTELRGRTESEGYLLTRARMGVDVTASRWLRFTGVLQDARAFNAAEDVRATHANNLDVINGYAELGEGEEGRWMIRAGRQFLSFGDERLMGSDSVWSNRATAFDGIRAALKLGRWRWNAFSSAVVQPSGTGLDRWYGPERVFGLYGRWTKDDNVVEPYVLHGRFRWASGARMVWSNPRQDALVELAGQSNGACAGYWEAGRRSGRFRAALSYSHASGQFNDLYPAGYNGCRFLEPFSWRNIRDARMGVEGEIFRKWVVALDYHEYWLADALLGIFVDQGPPAAATSSSRLGRRMLTRAQRSFGHGFDVVFGYAKFWTPNPSVRQWMPHSNSAFASFTARFAN